MSSQLLENWLSRVREELAATTYEHYRSVMTSEKNGAVSIIGPPEEWEPGDVTKFMRFLREDGNADTTRHIKLQVLKSFVGWAGDKLEHIAAVMPKRVAHRKSQPTVATRDEVQNLADAMGLHPKFKRAMVLMADAGLRETEVRNLRWRDVDLDSGRLAVRGKGNKNRSVPISTDRLQDALDVSGTNPDAFVFPGRNGTKCSRGYLGKVIKKWCQRLDLRELNPHSFRHSFAVQCVKSGIPVPYIQRALGHSSLAQTDEYLRGLDAEPGQLDDMMSNFNG